MLGLDVVAAYLLTHEEAVIFLPGSYEAEFASFVLNQAITSSKIVNTETYISGARLPPVHYA